jgi:hypothetical protein
MTGGKTTSSWLAITLATTCHEPGHLASHQADAPNGFVRASLNLVDQGCEVDGSRRLTVTWAEELSAALVDADELAQAAGRSPQLQRTLHSRRQGGGAGIELLAVQRVCGRLPIR